MKVIKGIFTSQKQVDETNSDFSFDSLFKEYYDRLVYFSFKLVNNRDQARDIVQEAFIKYWQKRDALVVSKIAVKNFLYSTVRNESLNCIRHTKVVDNYALLTGDREPEERPVIDAIITAEVISEIHSAIQSLPVNYRQVSILGYLEGKKNQEIAEELDLSINTVKKQKQRALQLLRLKLVPEIFVFALALIVNR
jgi:RNA polymerase sigma-70 factor (ECF subfamily)